MNQTELPPGWTLAKLGEICSHPQYGWTTSAKADGETKYLRTTDISGGKINWDTVPFCVQAPDDLSKYRVKENDILVSRAGSVGLSVRITDTPPQETVFASYLIRFNPLNGIEPRWVEHYLKTHQYWQAIDEASVGNALLNVNASKLADLDVPLPPLNEQRRIVAKLERVLARVDSCRARLDTVPTTLKRFRQSVLAAACSGRLTHDWREKNADVEPARVLAEQVANEDLPQSWQIANLAALSKAVVDCLHSTAKFTTDGKFCIDTTCMERGRIAFERARFVSEETFKERIRRLKPQAGDILFSREGTIGSCAVVPAKVDLCLGQRMMMFRPATCIEPEYFLCALQSKHFTEQIRDQVTGTTSPHVNIRDLKAMTLSLPPLEEQREIVRRVNELFAWADSLEARYKKARAHFDKIAQATLAKAFRGELVPQDPSDEPAESLLQKIRAQREETGAASTRKPRGKRVTSATFPGISETL